MLLAVAAALALAVPSAAAAPASVPGTREVSALLRGIPQDGAWLGKPTAPVVLVEYVDFQCPYCALFARQALPPIITRYVRTGKVRVLFRGLAFLGPDSVSTLRLTYAAGRQDRLWNVAELLFVNQGKENSGWAKQSLQTAIAKSVPVLSLTRLRRDTARVGKEVDAAATAARLAKVPGTPYLQAGRSLLTLDRIELKTLDSREIAAKLDALLRR